MTASAEFWRGKRVFLTGHTGFKGAWLSLWLARLGASTVGYSLPAPTRPSLYEAARVGELLDSREGDVRDLERLRKSLQDASPEVVIHMAAQSLVRASYGDPVGTFATNLLGTVHLLEGCRGIPGIRVVVVVTSDKCYEESAAGKPHREGDPLGGHDPYAASKACAELAVAAYHRSFLTKVGIGSVRAGNVIGGGDWAPDRLLPDLVGAFAEGRRARIRNPRATRPWQHVLDPLAGYLMLAERLHREPARYAGAWNFGPAAGDSAPVEEIANRAARLWGQGAAWEADPSPQPREAPALALDAGKAGAQLGWKPRLDLQAALEWTVPWYRSWSKGGDARSLAQAQLARFMEGK